MGPSVPENPDDRLIYPLGFTLCAWTLLEEWGDILGLRRLMCWCVFLLMLAIEYVLVIVVVVFDGIVGVIV